MVHLAQTGRLFERLTKSLPKGTDLYATSDATPHLLMKVRLTGLILCCLAWPVAAAEEDTASSGKTDVLMDVNLSLDFTEQYDSNVFRDADDDRKVDDWISILSPHAQLGLGYGIFRATLDLDYTQGWYQESEDDNYQDHWLGSDLRWRFNHRNELAFRSRFDAAHEDRGTELTEGGARVVPEPVEFDAQRHELWYQLGTRQSVGRLVLTGTYYEKQYSNFREFTRFRDYEENRVMSAFFWNVAGRTGVQFEATARDINYLTDPTPVSGQPDTLDALATEFLTGVNWNVTGKSNASVLLGYRQRNFDDNDREDFSGPSWRIDTRWSPKEHMAFTLLTAREDRETNGLGSFIDVKTTRAGWEMDWNSRFSSVLTLLVDKEDYEGTEDGRVDTNRVARFDFEYHMRYWLDFGVSLVNERNNSDIDRFNYERNLFLLFMKISNE